MKYENSVATHTLSYETDITMETLTAPMRTRNTRRNVGTAPSRPQHAKWSVAGQKRQQDHRKRCPDFDLVKEFSEEHAPSMMNGI